MEASIVKLQQIVKKLGGEDKLTAQTVESSDSPQQRLTKFEEMIPNVEKAVK